LSSSESHNPLLVCAQLPAFSEIAPEHIVPAVEQRLAEAREQIEELTRRREPHTWGSLAQPLDDLEERISRTWSPVSHLHAVADDPKIREAYNICVAKMSEYSTELGQNESLFRAFQTLADSNEYQNISQAQKKAIDNAIREFRLSGVDLEPAAKQRYKQISARLSALHSRFSENVLDATQGFTKHVTDESVLDGLPDSARALARETAEREGLSGWLLTLEAPSYFPVLSYADNTELRREMYEASTTRASDQGPNGGQWDNTDLIEEILNLRHEKATLLGFASFSDYSLETKMARSPSEVIEFLSDLIKRAKPVAEEELSELKTYAADVHDVTHLEAWDIAYYSEKLRHHRYAITQEELRPYFSVDRVLGGLFDIVGRLFGLRVEAVKDVDVWDREVRFFSIFDEYEDIRGHFYLDLFSRPHKRGGAWMDECVVRRRHAGTVQTPVAFLTCNFTPPVGDEPALLTHDEVTTLFHEFGHGLHHMLTLIDYRSVSGINGVAWDAVELPSQLMENWCWEREALVSLSGHWHSGEALSDEMLEQLRAAKSFQAGLKMIRQLEFALFDFRVHLEHDVQKGPRTQETLARVRREVAVIHPPAFNRFSHAFSHIFSGGYAAGYYSYLWAEVLSSDAYSKFEHHGVFDRATGREFMQCVLEQGGSRDAMALFVDFRGREPRNDALLRQSGIIKEGNKESVE
jgi:oligopeptidase A